MGGGDHARVRPQRVTGGQGLLVEDIHAGPGHMARGQGGLERLEVDDVTASGVDDDHARFGEG